MAHKVVLLSKSLFCGGQILVNALPLSLAWHYSLM
jgi:hypothetical protein